MKKLKNKLREEFYNYLKAQGFSDEQINKACQEIPEANQITGITREIAIRDFLQGRKDQWWKN